MARRASSAAEISLFPFLSILVCLIGSLVLLIVFLTLAQTATTDGRDPEDVRRSQTFASLTSEWETLTRRREQARAGIAATLGGFVGVTEKQDRLIQLRRDFSALAPEPPKETSLALQKRLENLLTQIEAMAREKPLLDKSIADLKAELAKRQKDPNAKPPPLLVQPGGSGLASQAKLFFVEAGAAGIALHAGKGEPPRISSGSIGTDDTYNKFLTEAKKSPNALLIFLIRPDGAGAYNLAAGWAENQFQLRTGKLPLPGNGAVDLSPFGIK